MSQKLTLEGFIAQLHPKCREAIEIIQFESSTKPLVARIKATGQIKTWERANSIVRNTTGFFKSKERQAPNTHSLEEYQAKIDAIFGEGKLQALNYKNQVSPASIKCIRCGKIKEYSTAVSVLRLDFACQDCDRTYKTKEDLQQELDEIFGAGEFEILEYIRANRPITLRHKCGMILKKRDTVKARGMLGCPVCKKAKSRGERDIAKFLLDSQIPFSTEISFSDLRGDKYPLRYDFGITHQNSFLLIEFDGEQHYEETSRFFTGQNTDERKTQYALEHNYPLLRIPYWEIKNVKRLIIDFLRSNDYPIQEYTSSEVEKLNANNSEDIVSSHTKV